MTYWINVYQFPDGHQGFGFFASSPIAATSLIHISGTMWFIGRWRITLKPHVHTKLAGLTPEML